MSEEIYMGPKKENEPKEKAPSIGYSAIAMIAIVGTLILGMLVFHWSEVAVLVLTLIVAACFGLAGGWSWDELMEGMTKGIAKAMPCLFFFFIIGMAIAAWIQCGCIPSMIYYGLNILSPGFFLPATLILCSVVAMCTGSSWTTAGTIGMVLLGVGTAMGMPEPLVAGCVLSGSYFGDKMSPMSDTTNLAPAIAGTDVFSHVAAMAYTAIPTWLICFVIYTVMGLKYKDNVLDIEGIHAIQDAITGTFNVNPIVIIPLIVTVVLIICKVPAIPTLIVGICIAAPITIFFQGGSFAGWMDVIDNGTFYETGLAEVDDLVNRGGIQGMMWTFSLGFTALALGGVITTCGFLKVLLAPIVKKLPSRKLLPAMTIVTGVAGCACLGEQYMSIVLTAELYKDIYPENGLERRMLSRNVEESSTVTANLFPWTTGGAFMYGALGVHPFTYAPYAICNWLTPLLGAIIPLTGWSLLTVEKAQAKGKEPR